MIRCQRLEQHFTQGVKIPHKKENAFLPRFDENHFDEDTLLAGILKAQAPGEGQGDRAARREGAVEFILELQRQRRNLTREAMSYFRGSDYNSIKQQRGGKRSDRKSKGQSDPLPSTAQQLAEKYGVSEKTIKRDAIFAQVVDKIVEDYGEPEIKRKLLGADVKLTQGTARVLLKKSGKDRKAAVDDLLVHGELTRAKKAAAPKPRPKDVAQALVTRLQSKGEGHVRSVLQQMARLMGMEIINKQ